MIAARTAGSATVCKARVSSTEWTHTGLIFKRKGTSKNWRSDCSSEGVNNLVPKLSLVRLHWPLEGRHAEEREPGNEVEVLSLTN